MIKDAIQYELDSRGYKRMDGNGVDMLVSFQFWSSLAVFVPLEGYVTYLQEKRYEQKIM